MVLIYLIMIHIYIIETPLYVVIVLIHKDRVHIYL